MSLNPEGEAIESPVGLARRLGLPFKDTFVLARALTHRSYINEHPDVLEDNERLEFLGDAVLDFVVGAWLYHHYPEMAEGMLTRMRSALVRTEQLAVFARQLHLGDAMRLGNGEARAGGRTRDALLCATFEAVIGALFLQAGIQGVQEFTYPLFGKAAGEVELQPDFHDPKSRLQEWSQAEGLGIPHYVTASAVGPDHARSFEVHVNIDGKIMGCGSGSSKQAAARAAAQNALETIFSS
jgi:ribonuclease-3